jgi:hypothetical protein
VNETGKGTGMKIFGVEILNEGSGVSIDDAVTEMQATFVARLVQPWQAVQVQSHQVSSSCRHKPGARGWDLKPPEEICRKGTRSSKSRSAFLGS